MPINDDHIRNFIVSIPDYIERLKKIRAETSCSLKYAMHILYGMTNHKNNLGFEHAFIFYLKGCSIKSMVSEKIYKLDGQQNVDLKGICIIEVLSRWIVMIDNKEIEYDKISDLIEKKSYIDIGFGAI